jgi:DNA-binding NtrC family response regulator
MDIVVPPLRERTEDIPVLADYFIRVCNRQNGLAVSGMQPQIYQLLEKQDWPGNIRELEHSIERACILAGAGKLAEEHFGFLVGEGNPEEKSGTVEPPHIPYRERQEKAEEESILQALECCRGNRLRTAEMLNISRATLFRKMKKYGLL